MASSLRASLYKDGDTLPSGDFTCVTGSKQPWSEDLDRQVKSVDLLRKSLNRNNEIFFFENENGEFVAYSILGIHHWVIDGVRTRISYLAALAVDRSQQGNGYGTQILKSMIQRARVSHEGTEQIGLLVHQDNHEGQRFYEAMGFVAISEPTYEHIQMILDMSE